MPMSSTTMRSLRQIRATVRAVDPSALARPMVVVNVSRVNHATRRSCSMALWAKASTKWDLPVPDGPATARFSWRLIHSSVDSACWVGCGMDDSSGRQVANVLPAGKFAVLRRIRRVAASRPMTSSLMSARSTSAGSHRWAYLCGSPVVQWWCVVGFGCSPIGAGFVGPGLESRLGRRPTRQGLVLTPVGSDGYCCDRERPRSAVHGWYSRVVRAAWWCGRAPWLTSVHGPLLVVLARRHDDGLGVPRWVRPLILWRSSPAREWRGDSPMAGAGRGRISVESVPGAHRCAAEGVAAA